MNWFGATAMSLVMLLAAPALANPAQSDEATAEPVVLGESQDPESEQASDGFSLQPFGYLRLLGSVVQDDPNVSFVGRADGFELQNARVGVRGRLARRVSFVLSADGAIDERDQLNDPNGRLRFGLRDAYADFHLASHVDFRAGRAYPLFDIEEVIGNTGRPFVSRALPSRGIRATDGWQTDKLAPGRSLGVALRRDPGSPERGVAVGWELAAQNGNDEFASDNDNDAVAVSAAGLLRLPNRSAVLIAGRYNPRTVGALPFQQDETDLQGSAGALFGVGPVSLAAGLILERTSFESTGGLAEYSTGAWGYGLLALPTAPLIDIGYRFGLLEPSDLISTDRVMEHTVGAVWSEPDWHLRVLVNATMVVEQDDRALDNNRLESVVELTL